jgi:hypothetical protein
MNRGLEAAWKNPWTDLLAAAKEALAKTKSYGHFIQEELRPTSGRNLAAVRITIAATITMLVSETLRVPFPDFSVYLVFFVANDDAARSFKLGLAVMVAATFGLAAAIAIDICFMGAPWFRVPATLLLVGGSVWLSRTLVLAALGRLLAVLLALNLSLADTLFNEEMLTRTTLWLWSVVGIAIGVTVLVNRLAETPPPRPKSPRPSPRRAPSCRMPFPIPSILNSR